MAESATPGTGTRQCATCGATFHCGRDDPEPCWCARDFPPVLPVPGEPAPHGCLCPACLEAAVARCARRD